MTTLNTTDDLLRAARENQEFREAFRREILTDDLVNLPQRVTEYHSATDAKVETLTGSISALTGNIDTLANSIADYMGTTDSRLEAIQNATEANAKGIGDLLSGITEMNRNIDEIRISHRAEHNALHRFRGNYAIETTRNRRIVHDSEVVRRCPGHQQVQTQNTDTR